MNEINDSNPNPRNKKTKNDINITASTSGSRIVSGGSTIDSVDVNMGLIRDVETTSKNGITLGQDFAEIGELELVDGTSIETTSVNDENVRNSGEITPFLDQIGDLSDTSEDPTVLNALQNVQVQLTEEVSNQSKPNKSVKSKIDLGLRQMMWITEKRVLCEVYNCFLKNDISSIQVKVQHLNHATRFWTAYKLFEDIEFLWLNFIRKIKMRNIKIIGIIHQRNSIIRHI